MIIDANGNKIYFERDANVDEFITGKEKTYTSQTGLEFRFDINTRSALTDDPKTFIHFYKDVMRGYYGSFPILHIHGRAICFTQRPQKDREVLDRLSPTTNKDGKRYWELGHVGAQLNHKDPDRPFSFYPLTNASSFSSRQEQELALTFVVDVLKRYHGDWIGLAHGEDVNERVVVTPEFQQKLNDGVFIDGANS